MHLLTAQTGSADNTLDPIDLNQSPGDVVVLTSADTEITGLARAYQVMAKSTNANQSGVALPSLRLANLLNLSHNYSVDLYLEKTLRAAKLIIIRVLGGPSYWQYGLDEVRRLARGEKIKLAVISGSAAHDETLDHYSTIAKKEADQLWAYLVEGGAENYQNFLRYAGHLLSEISPKPAAAKPLPKAGLYWPGAPTLSLEELQNKWQAHSHADEKNRPITAITFYRALLQGDDLNPINELIKSLQAEGHNPLPIFAASLKDEIATEIIEQIFKSAPPQAVINTTSFAIAIPGKDWQGTVLDQKRIPVFQAILSGSNETHWQENPRGLIARDIAMNVALPEIDGRITTRAISFKAELGQSKAVEANLTGHKARPDRITFVTELVSNWIKLAQTPLAEKRIALILSNYPSTDGRIANGVGLDTPAGTLTLLNAMKAAGYQIQNLPETPNELIKPLLNNPSNWPGWQSLSLDDYQAYFQTLPECLQTAVTNRWGPPQQDPSFQAPAKAFQIRALKRGNLLLGLQPGRGNGLDAKDAHHDGTIPPTHGYIAFYLFLRQSWHAHAVIHMGKHGNLEWMPGKALALSNACTPEALLGPMPHIYPFIVNDPGEGAQAKRRTSAVIIDHLTPPLTRAESYGPIKDLEALVDEYYEAAGVDPRRTTLLGREIIHLALSLGLAVDCEIKDTDSEDEKLQKLDNYLCELKELQIRDGLHIFGQSPKGAQKTNMLLALTRLPRGNGQGQDQSLLRALANDLGLSFDPLMTQEPATPWPYAKPKVLQDLSSAPWRTFGDTIERLEQLAEALIKEQQQPERAPTKPTGPETKAVLTFIQQTLTQTIEACGPAELNGVLNALEGRFIAPAPSGAPTRGRLDTLPTGRNFFTIDTRTLPTETAWKLGSQSAEKIIKAYTQEHGSWPKQIAMSAWGTANMRTGGDDIAQALAFIGAKPQWDAASRRVTGFEIIPLRDLQRPRVDLIFRISGFFRDAFPAQIELLQSAIDAVAALEEDEAANPLAAALRNANNRGTSQATNTHLANPAARIFGPAEMNYGAGLKDIIQQGYQGGPWRVRSDLAESYITSSAYIYGGKAPTNNAHAAPDKGHSDNAAPATDNAALFHLKALLKSTSLVIHNQDTREFDLLDSEDFYVFEGGLAAAVEEVSGKAPEIYHNDHANPHNPKVQTLSAEIAKIVRGRAANPKWITAIMRHGAKGASEMLATVSNLTAFARLTNSVKPHHFESLYEAYLVDEKIHAFLKDNNQPALEEMISIFQNAIDHGLWQPKRNSTYHYLADLKDAGDTSANKQKP